MRRHNIKTNTEAVSYQIKGSVRIDPYNRSTSYHCKDMHKSAARLTGREGNALFAANGPGHVQIKGGQALVECKLESGLPLIVRIPLSYYEGIGARFVVSKREGNPVICLLELVHKDPQLTVPVAVSVDLEDTAIDWQSWSRKHDLAMLHWPLQAEGYEPVAIDGFSGKGIAIEPQAPRRPHAQFAARRPRFLTRRKTGQQGVMSSVAGREIIARN